MSNLVIVAIPAKDDAVWKVSTEKVPHLTLLFLGEMQDDDGDLAEDTQRIVDFVGHAVDVAEHGQFMMDVDYRDNLGPDDADVLFFKKNGWSSKWITQFRGQLLQQTDIKTAYDSSPQYEEWTPHLTLGYPTAPAKDDAIEHPISWISFDRIAVWTGDYEGPEFRLQWPERDGDLALAYSDTGEAAIADILAHHGVKGMRWSVRKEDATTVKHAAQGDPNPQDHVIEFKLRRHPSGKIKEMNKAELADPEDLADGGVDEATEMVQSVKIGEQFVLEHYGVLGMKWGRRKEESSGPPAPVAPHATSRVPQGNKRKTQIETSGGENHPAHEDAIKVAKAQAKLKKSGLAALSNRELQDVATRVQLEKQVSLLTGHKGKQFVQKHLRTSGDELTRQTIRTGIKRAGIAAVLA